MHVVIVAFGPVSVTKQAVRRAQAFSSHPVTVVKATPDVRIGTGMVPRAAIADATGSNGVRSTLAQFGDDLVLLIHDDATITARGARTLQAAFDGASLVVPHSNELGTGQFLGPLPPARAAAAELDRLRLSPGAVDEARVSCVLGPAHALRSTGGSLVVPGSMVQADTRISVAPCAVAHDLTCVDHRARNDGLDGRPLLVASMIVRDEEQRLAGALESLAPIVDRIEICDTGSTDRTMDIAHSFGANVREIEWRNDFAWARNRALETARDAHFVIFIDADERVMCDDPVVFRDWLATWRAELVGLNVGIHSTRGEEGPGTNHLAQRIARASLVEFDGALHESLRFLDEIEFSERPVVSWYRGIAIEHEGYLPEVVAERGKADRNVAIARAAFQADPTMKTRIDYARSLRMQDDADPEAETLFRQALDLLDDEHSPRVRAFVEATVAAYELTVGNHQEAVTLALEALDRISGEDLARATLAHALASKGDFADLIGHDRRLSGLPNGRPLFSIPSNHHRYEATVARALIETGEADEGIARLVAAVRAAPSVVSDIAARSIPAIARRADREPALYELIVADESGHIVSAMASCVPPEVTAALCAAAAAGGDPHPTVIVTGLTAALLKGMDEVVEMLLAITDRVPADMRLGLADLARRRGRPDIASALERSLLASVAL